MYRKKREIIANFLKRLLWWQPVAFLLFMFVLGACSGGITNTLPMTETVTKAFRSETTNTSSPSEEKFISSEKEEIEKIDKDGEYTSKEEVALYIHIYGKLPKNYITKKKAQQSGWNPKVGNLSKALPGMSIGGSAFGNYEGKLPVEEGRKYYECDIDYQEGFRNSKRIVYSNDGLIFYTEDHYESFEQLY